MEEMQSESSSWPEAGCEKKVQDVHAGWEVLDEYPATALGKKEELHRDRE